MEWPEFNNEQSRSGWVPRAYLMTEGEFGTNKPEWQDLPKDADPIEHARLLLAKWQSNVVYAYKVEYQTLKKERCWVDHGKKGASYLADRIKISHSLVPQILNGAKPMTLMDYLLISHHFGIHVNPKILEMPEAIIVR